MKIGFFNSLRVQTIIAVIVMFIIPFALLQVINMLLIYNQLENKTSATTQAFANSISANLRRFMQNAYDFSEHLASDIEVLDMRPEGNEILVEAKKNMQYFDLLFVQGMDGMQTIRSNGELGNRSSRWWFKKIIADHEPFISEAYISVLQYKLVTSIFLPMIKDGNMVGVFGADISVDALQEIVTEFSTDKNISFIIMDSKGAVVANTDFKQGEFINYKNFTKVQVLTDENGEYKLDRNGYISTKVENLEVSDTMKKIVSEALDRKSNSFKFMDKKGNIVVCAFQPIVLPGKSEPWSVIVFQVQTRNYTFVLLVICLAFITLVSIFIAAVLVYKKIISPVLGMDIDMEKIVDGNLDVTIGYKKKNELGQLAENINIMVRSLKQHQKNLDENEKMAALGTLVAGVAHEINTPLGIGVTTSTYLSKVNDDNRTALQEGRFTKVDLMNFMESMDEGLGVLQFNLERASEIIQSFKRIAIDQSNEVLVNFNVIQYINSIILSLKHEYKKHNHEFIVDCGSELSIISYPGAFAQILTNLIINALQHAFHNMEQGIIKITASMKKNEFYLVFSDNGCGIPPEILPHIFEPFFTTRRSSGGSGLGLNIVYNIVTKRLNGKISVESTVGTGTVFTISFPVKVELDNQAGITIR